MIELISLKLKNFMSFGNDETVIDLSQKGIVYVVGKNLDTNSANGVGKCVSINTLVRIRNKNTQEIMEITVGELFELAKKKKSLDA